MIDEAPVGLQKLHDDRQRALHFDYPDASWMMRTRSSAMRALHFQAVDSVLSVTPRMFTTAAPCMRWCASRLC